MWETGWGESSTKQERGDSRRSEGDIKTFGQKNSCPVLWEIICMANSIRWGFVGVFVAVEV